MRIKKTCCFIGQRECESSLATVKKRIDDEVKQAIQDGYKIFTTYLEPGANLLFIECVLAYKQTRPALQLEIALPYSAQTGAMLPEEKIMDILAQAICLRAPFLELDERVIVQERNKLMLERANRVILLEQDEKSLFEVAGVLYPREKQIVQVALA